MKLVVQIPCWNEERHIAETLRSIPRRIDGVESIEIIVIDDGSTDRTADVARECGANEVVKLPRHLGLARAFFTGVQEALGRGADILVNTDADLQYPSRYIQDIVRPVVDNAADIVIGDRLSQKPRPFSWPKMLLQRLGSRCVGFFAGVQIKDAASGFRALNRDAMESMVIHGSYSYTLESLILAGMQKLRIAHIPITTNRPTRSSRLFNTLWSYIIMSSISILRAYLMYHPLKFFAGIGLICMGGAAILGLRFLVFFLCGQGAGHVQSLILLAILVFMGFQCIVIGMIGDVVSANRRLMENIRIAILRRQFNGQ
jgi:glycosyltransferase involved in cell wall biosynthesis